MTLRTLSEMIYVRLPNEIVIPYGDSEDSVNELIDHVFPSLHDEKNANFAAYMSTHVILSTKNIIDRFPRQANVYHNFNSVDDDLHNSYTPNGLPPHELKVKSIVL